MGWVSGIWVARVIAGVRGGRAHVARVTSRPLCWMAGWRLIGLGGRSTVGEVLGAVIGRVVLGVVDHRGRLHGSHFIVQISVEGVIISEHHLSDAILHSDIEVAFLYDVDEGALWLSGCCGKQCIVRPQNRHPSIRTRWARWTWGTRRARNAE